MKILKRIEAWLDGWNDHPGHIVTVAVIILALGGLAIIFAYLAQ